jgi:tetratricopeptide (TPR) repeat protein
MFERALEGYEKTWGQEHTSALNSVNNLGNLYGSQDRFQEAEPLFIRAIEGYEKTWGREHTSTLNAINNLGTLYQSKDRPQEAHALFKRALEGYEVALGSVLVATYIPALNTLENLGLICAELERSNEALLFYQRALSGTKAVFGQISEAYSSLLDRINSLKCDMHQPEGGMEIFTRSKTTKLERKWKKLRAKLPIMPKTR